MNSLPSSEQTPAGALPRGLLIETGRQHATSVAYTDSGAKRLVVPAPPSPLEVMRTAQRLFLSPMGGLRTQLRRALGRWGGREYLRDGPVLERLRLHDHALDQMVARVTVARSETRMTAAFLDRHLTPALFAKVVGPRSDAAIRNEYTWLSRLRQTPDIREQIPAPLRCWQMDGLTVLELRPLEHATKGPHAFSDPHERFLEQLQCCTQKYSGRGEPLPSRIDRRLNRLAFVVSPALHETLTAAAREFHQRWADQQRRVVAHGDFTPWNVLLDGGRIRIVDWENVAEDCPPLYDYFHFTVFPLAVKNAFRRADLARVLERASSLSVPHWYNGAASAARQFLAYLLDVVTAYLEADDGQNERSALVQQYSRLLTHRAEWLR